MIFALATPVGKSAIAVIRVAGEGCHKKINSSFLKIAKENAKRFVVIDASKDKDQISDLIWNTVKKRLLS